MRRFFVGQRVRLVRAKRPENLGLEGRISFIGRTGNYWRDGYRADEGHDCIVDWLDVDWTPQDFPDLEPILDPGREVISWEKMRGIWTPEGVTA